MGLVAVAVWLALAGPAPSSEAVGVAWYRKATVDGTAQQRLHDAALEVFELAPEDLVDDAVATARREVSYEIPLEQIDALAETEQRMNRGNLRFRVGEFDAAEAEAELVVDAVRQNPVLPGGASLLWRAHLLRARVAWTRADEVAAAAALRAAATVDPTARLSTRRVPPDLAAVYARQVEDVRAAPWEMPEVEVGDADLVEIDGQPGLRAVGPGEHVLVVRRPGHPAVGAVFQPGAPIRLPESEELVPDRFPSEAADAQNLCDRLGLGRLVLARQRGERIGLELFECGEGYSAAWYGLPGETAARGLAVVASSARFDAERSALPSADPWPEPVSEVPIDGPDDGPPVVAAKPWYRRAWVWVVVGVVVAGAVTAGAVVGTLPPDRVYRVDPDFNR